ncbi:Pyruvate carboxylase like protein [Verticillium longisporum]|nr:Pyruvate carboxylase like protein [Verticillium longisporum]
MFGSWSSYQFDGSGYAIINTIERGVYLVKMTKRASCPKKQSCNADNCLRSLRSSSIKGRLEESQKFCGEFTKTYVSDVKVVPEYASKACGTNVISRVSSACHCLPTPTATTPNATETQDSKVVVFQHGVRTELALLPPKWFEKALGLKEIAASVVAPMPCKVLRNEVAEGDVVKKGAPLVVIESMKMETVIRSPQDGVVKKLAHKEGDICKAGTVLVLFEEEAANEAS